MGAASRVWMTGLCTQRIDAVAAQISARVTRSGGQLSDWQDAAGGQRGVLATWPKGAVRHINRCVLAGASGIGKSSLAYA